MAHHWLCMSCGGCPRARPRGLERIVGSIGPNPAPGGRQEDGGRGARSERAAQGILVHRDHQPLRVDAAWAALHGYRIDEIMAMDSVVGLISPRHQQRMVAHCQAHLSGQPAPSVYEYQAVHASGRLIWCEARLQAVDWDGAPAIQCTIRDITERKRFEEQFKVPDRALEAAANAAFITRADDGMRLVYANPAAERLTGYRLDEMLGRNCRFLQGEDRNQEGLAEIRAGLAEQRACQAVLRNYRKDGTRFWNQISIAPVTGVDGEITHFIGILQDVTERKRAEHALAQSEKKYHDLYDGAPDMMAAVDPKTAIVKECNQTLAANLGYTKDEIAGQPIFSLYHPDCMEDVKTAFQSFAENGHVTDKELQLRRKDGSKIDVSLKVSSVRDQEGNVTHSSSIWRDITERKAAEDALRESEQRFRDLIEGSIQGTLIHRDGKPLFANQALADMFAYDGPEEIIALGSVPQLEAAHERDRLDAYGASRLQGLTSPKRYEFEGLRKDGSPIWLENFVTVVDWQGEPAVQSTIIDISERKAAEDALQESEARFRDVVDAASDWIWEQDENLRFTYFSDRFREVTGRSDQEMLGKTRLELLAPDDEDVWAAHLADLTARRPFRNFRYSYIRPSGERLYQSVSGVPIFDPDGTFRGYRGTGTDLTAEVETEEALRRSETRFHGAFETAVHGMALTAPDGRFLEVNPALCRMLGYPDTELRRRSYESVVHPEDLAKGLDHLGRMQAGEIRSFQHEERWVRSDGDTAWVLASVALVADAAGAPDHLVWQLLDLTERKQADERLRQSQKMEAIGQLTGGVAHDFNNLLTVILGNARLLERRFGDDAQSGKMAESISKAAKRGAELVQHLLAFSRKQTLETQAVQVGELVQGMHAMLRRTLEVDIKITSRIGDDLHDALVDPNQLESALLNLSVNARDAMAQGGTLTIEVANFRAGEAPVAADVNLAPGRDYVAIAVSDTGTGIPPEQIKQIFEPFFTTKEVGKGTGLGLSMVFGFIQQSGGQIHVESEVGRGTMFTLYLPAVEAQEDRPTCAAAANGEEPRGCETILVVEDEADVRHLATVILRGLGYSVIAAENGPDALGVLNQPTDIDLLFTDLVMPGGMNGKELATVAMQQRPGLKVLFTTGYSSGILSEARDVGDDGTVITKPYDDEDLSRKVREILDARAH